MAIKPYSGKWITKTFTRSTAYALYKGMAVMLSSGFAVKGSSSAGIQANPLVGFYTGPAVASGAMTTGTIQVQVPMSNAVVIADTSGSATTGTIGNDYGLSSGSATGLTNVIGIANTTVTPFTNIGMANASGQNLFSVRGGTLFFGSVS